MIKFKSTHIYSEIKEWQFDSVKKLYDVWMEGIHVPENDDPIYDVEIDGEEVYVGRKPDKDERESDVAVWFEDLLTYVGIDYENGIYNRNSHEILSLFSDNLSYAVVDDNVFILDETYLDKGDGEHNYGVFSVMSISDFQNGITAEDIPDIYIEDLMDFYLLNDYKEYNVSEEILSQLKGQPVAEWNDILLQDKNVIIGYINDVSSFMNGVTLTYMTKEDVYQHQGNTPYALKCIENFLKENSLENEEEEER